MNKVYRIIYNETTGTWAAVSEITPGRRKSGRNNTIALTVTAAAVVAAGAVPDEAWAGKVQSGEGANVENAINGIAIGNRAYAKGTGDNVISIGNGTVAVGKSAVAFGISTNATGNYAHAYGDVTNVTTNSAVGVGIVNNINSNSDFSNTFGGYNTIKSGSTHSNALGSRNTINENTPYATAVGSYNTVSATNGTAVGRGNTVSAVNGVAIGVGATASHADAVALGSSSKTSDKATVTPLTNKNATGVSTPQAYAGNAFSTVSIGAAGKERQLQNVAAGRVSADSTDAVNGSQLYAVATKTGFNIQQDGRTQPLVSRVNNDHTVNFAKGDSGYTNVTASLSGETTTVKYDVITQNINPQTNGSVVAATGNNAGLATTATVVNAINQSGFTLQANGQNGSLIKPGATVNFAEGNNIKIEKASNIITVKTVDSPRFTSVTTNSLSTNGLDMNNNKITGVKDGTSDTDAVNFKQLNQAIANSSGSWKLAANQENNSGTVDKNNNVVRVIEGKNMNVSRNGNNITVKTIDNPEFTSLKTGGLTATGTTNLKNTVIDGSLNMSGNKITNIGKGTADNDVANVQNIKEAVKELSDKGLKHKGNEGEILTPLGSELTIKGSLNGGEASSKNIRTKAQGNTVEILFAESPTFKNLTVNENLTTKNLTATGDTNLKNTVIEGSLNAKGDTTIGGAGKNFNVTNGTTVNMGGNKITNVTTGTADGDVTNVKQVKDSIKDAVDGVTANLTNKGLKYEGNTGDTTRKLGETLKIQGGITGTNVAVSGKNVRTQAQDGLINILFAENPEFTSLKTGDFTATGNTVLGGAGKTVTVKPDTTVDMGNNKITNVGKGEQPNDVANLQNVQEEVNKVKDELTNQGLKYAGNTGDTTRKLGETLTIKGSLNGGDASSKNIRTKAENGVVEILFADSPTFKDLTVTNKLTTKDLTATGDTNLKNTVIDGNLNAKGDTTLGGNGKTVMVNPGTTVNMGGNKITNVTTGTADGDVTNVKQVKDAIKEAVDGATASLTNKGLKFKGNQGETTRALGDTLNIEGGITDPKVVVSNKNIRTEAENGLIKILFADNPEFANLKVTDKLTTKDLEVTGDTKMEGGLTVKGDTNLKNTVIEGSLNAKGNTTVGGGQGTTFKVTENTVVDMGGNPITNVGKGQNDTDAANIQNVKEHVANAINNFSSNGAAKYTGNNGEVITRKFSDVLAVNGSLTNTAAASSKNIRTEANNGTGVIEIKFADSPDFTNLTVNEKLKTKDLEVTGNTDMKGNLNVDGDTNLKGNTTIGGAGKTFNVAGGTTVDMGGNKITNVQAGEQDGDVTNVKQVKDAIKEAVDGATAGLTDKGLKYEGNKGETSRKLGETLKIQGGLLDENVAVSGKNIRTEAENGLVKILFADSPEFTNLKVNEKLTAKDLEVTGDTKMEGDLTVKGETNLKNTVIDGSLTAKGDTTIGGAGKTFNVVDGTTVNMGGNKITNIGKGEQGTDAANMDNVKEAVTAATKGLTDKGMSYAGDVGETILLPLGSTLTVSGNLDGNAEANSDNIRTQTDKNTGKIEILFAESPTFKNLTVNEKLTTKDLLVNGNLSVDGDTHLKGNTIIGGTGKTFNIAGGTTVDMGGNTISNIGKGEKGTDAANIDNVKEAVAEATKDLTDKGLKYAGNEGDTTIKLGDMLTIKGSLNTATVASSNNIRTKAENGIVEILFADSPEFTNLKVNEKLTVKDLVVDNNTEMKGDLTVKGNTNLKNTVIDGNLIANGDTTIGGAGKTFNVVGGTTVDMGGNTITNVGKGEKGTDAANMDNVKEAVAAATKGLTDKGMSYAGDVGETILLPLGSTLTLSGNLDKNTAANSNNIRTQTDKNTGKIEILFAESPTFKNLTVNEKLTTGDLQVTGDTTLGGQGKSVNIVGGTTVNMGGNRIQNVADAQDGGDATNLNQVRNLIQNSADSLNAKGMNYVGDTGETILRPLGSTLTVTGNLDKNAEASSNNIRTHSHQDSGKIEILMADNPEFKNVTVRETLTTKDLVATNNVQVGGDLTVSGNTNLGGQGKTVNIAGGSIFNIGGGSTVNMGGNRIQNVADAQDGGDATNLNQVRNLIQNSADSLSGKGMNYAGDTGETILRPLGSTLTVTGNLDKNAEASSNNIRTHAHKDSGKIEVLMADNPEFKNVAVKESLTTKDLTATGNTMVGGGEGTSFTVAEKTLVDMGGNTVTNIGEAKNATDAINLGQVTELIRSTESKLVEGGQTFAGNTGTVTQKLGQKLDIVGGNRALGGYSSDNIRTVVENGKVEIQMAESPDFKNIRVAGALTALGDVKLGGEGKTLTVETGTTVNMGGNTVTNIAPGAVTPDSTDAVSGSQLYQMGNRVNTLGDGVNTLAGYVADVDKDLRGGVAGAVAGSLLPQAMNPGERLMGVSAGTYRGASALAIGYSQVTDNGKYIIKFAGSINSRKHTTAGVAVGYRF